jgi:hypothetical protein
VKRIEINNAALRGIVWVQAGIATVNEKLREDRGDIPGWVLVTVMTAGLVVAVWSVADGQLRTVLTRALRSVSQP